MSIFDGVCKTNIDLVNRLKEIEKNYKTLYIMGCFGAPMTDKNKKRYTSNHSYNKKAERTAMINAASADTFGFDCVGLIKGVLWGWNGDQAATYGGAKYNTNNVPDTNANGMIKACKDVSTDFSKIEVGEAVWMEGHIGVYIGGGLAIECSPKWKNKVQVTACNQTVSGYNRRDWTKHGKLPYVEYVQPVVEPEKEPEVLPEFHLLDKVRIKNGITTYASGKEIASWVLKKELYVRELLGERTVVSTLKEGAITGTVWTKDLELIESAPEAAPEVAPEVAPVEPETAPAPTKLSAEEVQDIIKKVTDLMRELLTK